MATKKHMCLVMEMRLDGRSKMPKHLAFHEPHFWWYTSWGGGHQLFDGWEPSDAPNGWDEVEKYVEEFYCPGWRPKTTTFQSSVVRVAGHRHYSALLTRTGILDCHLP